MFFAEDYEIPREYFYFSIQDLQTKDDASKVTVSHK